MNLQKLCEHTVDIDLMPEVPIVLDVGCRDFGFCREIWKHRPAAKITGLDPDPKIELPEDIQQKRGFEFTFHRMALIAGGTPPGEVWYEERGGEANAVVPFQTPKGMKVPAITMRRLLSEVPYFDVIKFDCEASEFGILEDWPGRVAGQISVEFHDYTNWLKWDDKYFSVLFAGPLRDYQVIQHERFGLGPGNDMGHWDSLLALR